MTVREIGSMLNTDYTSIYRTIVRALRNIQSLSLSENIVVIGLDDMENWLIRHFNDISDPPKTERGPYRKSEDSTKWKNAPSAIELLPAKFIFIRGSETRQITIGDPSYESIEPKSYGSWGSGRFVSMLREKAKSVVYRKHKSRIMAFLIKLFLLFRRDYQ